MNKISLFFVNFLLSAVRHIGSIVISIIFIIVGAIWSKVCLYIGIFLIASNVIVALVGAIRMQKLMNYRSDDDPEFNEMMDELSADPKAFISEVIDAWEEKKALHGEELLTLSDEDLFETVEMQNYDIIDDAEDVDEQLKLLSGARKTVYILSMFDAEIQNGGLCQFYANSSSAVAPFVSEALKCVGAQEHLKLFEEFNKNNNIDVCDLESFKVRSIRGFKKQTKRFDFDAFDDSYYDLPALQDKSIAYIKNNISEF